MCTCIAWKGRTWNDLCCIRWDVKPYLLTFIWSVQTLCAIQICSLFPYSPMLYCHCSANCKIILICFAASCLRKKPLKQRFSLYSCGWIVYYNICFISTMVVQLTPLICTLVISTLCLFAQRASSLVWVYAMSMAVNFACKHQPYMHNLAISTHSFGFSVMTYFGNKQLADTMHVRPPVVSHLTLTGMPVTTSEPQNYAGRQN